jgi:uncharacterized repeat protein (TIGR01451 family)
VTEIVYTVDEVDVPAQYEKVVDGGTITNKCTYIKTSVIIGKYEDVVDNKFAVAGATLQILDINGNVVVLRDGTVCEWITGADDNAIDEFELSAHLIEHLPAGTYVLHEKSTPNGYATAEDVVFTVTETVEVQYVYLVEKPIVVQIDKLDKESGVHLIGAEMILLDSNMEPVLDKDGNVITWITDGHAHAISHLPVGTYYLHEVKAPVGYQKAEDVLFTVIDTEEIQTVTMYDERTVGLLEINKVDASTKLPLANVIFNVTVDEDVIDPITGEIIFAANEVIDVLTTDENGFAKMSKHVPIGTYGATGFDSLIKYRLIEIKAVDGQYDALAVNRIVEFAYVDDATPIVEMHYDIENSKPEVVVNKTGVPTTFVGDYANKQNVTVLKNGERITYIITIENIGLAPAWNVVVRDFIPSNTTFVEMDIENNGFYDATTNCVYWTVDKVDAGDSVTLTFTVQVDSDNACEIVNTAQYAMPNIVPENDEDFLDPTNNDNAWLNTNCVVHQIVTLSKDASIEHGKDETDSVHVEIGTQFTYTITFNTTNTVYGFTMCDPIPSGLTFVPGTAKYTLPGCDPVVLDTLVVGDDNVIAFPTIDEVPAGITTFSFDVIVDDVELYNETYQFVNTARALMQSAKDSETMLELETNSVSNKTIKIKTGEDIPQTGDDISILMWSSIACVCAIAMIALGIYGYCDEKKNRR